MKMSFSQERAIIALGLHSFRGGGGGCASGSKLIEQTLHISYGMKLVSPFEGD